MALALGVPDRVSGSASRFSLRSASVCAPAAAHGISQERNASDGPGEMNWLRTYGQQRIGREAVRWSWERDSFASRRGWPVVGFKLQGGVGLRGYFFGFSRACAHRGAHLSCAIRPRCARASTRSGKRGWWTGLAHAPRERQRGLACAGGGRGSPTLRASVNEVWHAQFAGAARELQRGRVPIRQLRAAQRIRGPSAAKGEPAHPRNPASRRGGQVRAQTLKMKRDRLSPPEPETHRGMVRAGTSPSAPSLAPRCPTDPLLSVRAHPVHLPRPVRGISLPRNAVRGCGSAIRSATERSLRSAESTGSYSRRRDRALPLLPGVGLDARRSFRRSCRRGASPALPAASW
jgi:hypothetical protein